MGGGGNPFDAVSDAISDAANAVMEGVEHVSPLVDHIVDPFDILPDSIRIPGTDLRVSLASFLLGPLIGLPFIPFRRHENGSNNLSTVPSNPYYTDLKVYVNDVDVGKMAFNTPTGFASAVEISKYFKENPQIAYIDICVPLPNSTISLLFNDSTFDNNDGLINVSICYLGEADTCSCISNQEQEAYSLSVGFSRIDQNLQYPVSCHGMVYVGDKNNGLSTGGRCEKSTIVDAETKINQKYSNKYSVNFDDTETSDQLENSRVLDLVYKFNGTAWIRQQNMIESVYYHTGLGNDEHSIFFGGIHESLANYTFNYTNNLNNIPIPEFSQFNFDNKYISEIIEQKLYGQIYPNTLQTSLCWETPEWMYDSNFSSIPNRISNPTYSPEITTNYMGYITDPDFPPVKFVSIQPDGVFEFGTSALMYSKVFPEYCPHGGWLGLGGNICNALAYVSTQTAIETQPEVISGASSILFAYPTIDSLNITGNFSTATKNYFTVKAITSTISGTPVEFNGEIKISDIRMSYPNRVIIYPNDIVAGSITNEKKYISLKSMGANEENVNLVGAFQHSFEYTSTLGGGISGHNTRGLFTLIFNSLDDIYNGIINDQYVEARQNFTVIDSSMFPISASYISGIGKVKFDVNKQNGVMIGIINSNYNWKDSLESSNFNISDYLNINATIGSNTQERWGTPLWSAAFVDDTSYLGNYTFNSRTSKANTNTGDILHEITSIILESNSLMALVNNRIYVEGSTQSQEHQYEALNDIKILALWNVDSITYEPNSLGQLYNQSVNLDITGNCIKTYTPSASIVNITGYMVSEGAACCSGSHKFPSHLFMTGSDIKPISASDGSYSLNVHYNYIDECVWQVYSVNYSGGQSNEFNYSTNCIYSCPNTTVESLVTGQVTGNKVFNFPSDNFVLTNVSTSHISANTYNKSVKYDLIDDTQWIVQSIIFEEYIPLIGCTLSETTPIQYLNGSNYTTGTPLQVVTTSCSGIVGAFGSPCCSGDNMFPFDFTYISTTTIPSGTDLFSIVEYRLYNGCTTNAQAKVTFTLKGKHIGNLNTILTACAAGELTIKYKTCETICDETITHTNSATINIGDSGNTYSEYSTNFIQEYRNDERYLVPEYLVTSNANNIITKNKGIMVHSNWKRYMDGVGFGGDAPDYDTIFNTKAKQTYPLSDWKEIGYWNIGQMAFGTVDNAIVVGGHKISRNVGDTIFGSGLHSSPTSKRIYVWSTQDIPEEDSYLKNYYGRRFNTYYPTSTYPISSNNNLSTLSCIIFDAESNIVVERFGTINFDGSTDSIDVKFDKEMPPEVDVNYSLSMTCDDNVKVWWDKKTTTGFTIKCELKDWKGKVDYIASTVIKTTEDDIVKNDAQNGYIFNK